MNTQFQSFCDNYITKWYNNNMKYSICVFDLQKYHGRPMYEVHAFENDELTHDGLLFTATELIQQGVNLHSLTFNDTGDEMVTDIFPVGNIVYYNLIND